MKDKLIYKEFMASVHYSDRDGTFFGQIEGINDLVTFEGQTVKELKAAFEESVDDYIDLCQETGKPPMKSFKGSFNVRISPELHGKIFKKAMITGQSLNQLVQKAIEKDLSYDE